MKAEIAYLAGFLALLLPSGRSPAGEWRQFRGTDTSGVAAAERPPLAWDGGRGVAWKSALPGRGLSSPIVAGGRVLLTASSGDEGDRLHVLSFDAASGKRQWERQFWATGLTQCHPKTSMAAPTPASDGKRVFALFASNDVVCLDLDGGLLWVRGLNHDYPNASNSVGMASSLLVVGEVVVAQLENDSDSFAVGLDATTGANVWKIRRPAKVNWTTPMFLPPSGDRAGAVLLASPGRLSGIEPATGREAWSLDVPCEAIPSAALAGDVLFVPAKGLTALRLGASGAAPAELWSSQRLRPSTPSPLVYENRVYAISGSILKCGEAATGKDLWQLRLEGPFSSSPVAARGHIFCFNEQGVCQVVEAVEGKLAATSTLSETILCTPAIASGALFVRSDAHLWKLADS